MSEGGKGLYQMEKLGSSAENQPLETTRMIDTEYFRKLYKEYYSALCVYATTFTRDNQIAEEVVQDVFVKIWESGNTLSINTSISSYLFTSVKNASLNHLKHLQVVNRFSEYYTRKYQNAQDLYYLSQETGDSLLIARELEEQLMKEIESLPDRCRKIFKMSRFENMKHQEIADKLGVTVNTVHRQTSIALKRLKRIIIKSLALLVLSLKFLFA
ncbi:MAG TPA: RNA polymerase sigma-70 factor [Saprospiraceae bacterium]|nr:RNA polymerase sigma-70 factor [Saprospiraceae bacterium]